MGIVWYELSIIFISDSSHAISSSWFISMYGMSILSFLFISNIMKHHQYAEPYNVFCRARTRATERGITGTARGEVLDKLLQSRECVIQEIGSVRPILLHVLLLILWWNG